MTGISPAIVDELSTGGKLLYRLYLFSQVLFAQESFHPIVKIPAQQMPSAFLQTAVDQHNIHQFSGAPALHHNTVTFIDLFCHFNSRVLSKAVSVCCVSVPAIRIFYNGDALYLRHQPFLRCIR